MSHFSRTHPDAGWAGIVTLQSDWQSLADKGFESVNGDQGGTYAPSSFISISASGMSVTGPTEVNYGGFLKTLASSRFKLGNNEWPSLGPSHVGRTRVLRSPVHTRLCTPHYHFADCPTYTGSIQAIACTIVSQAGLEQPECHIPLRVHDGARLASGIVKIRVPTPRSKSPVQLPRLRVIRVDKSGLIESLRAPSDTVDADGYSSFPAVASGDAWYAGGAAQAWTFTTDQNNVIDVSSYVYYVQFIEEVGTTDPSISLSSADGSLVRERKSDVAYVYEGVLPPGTGNPNPVPGGPPPTLVSGDSILTAEAPYGIYNGIWTVSFSGTWPRRTDLAASADFTPNFIVYDKNTSCFWECVRPKFGQTIRLTDSSTFDSVPNATEVHFQRRQPRGNIYHSITCTFDQISDMRPQ